MIVEGDEECGSTDGLLWAATGAFDDDVPGLKLPRGNVSILDLQLHHIIEVEQPIACEVRAT